MSRSNGSSGEEHAVEGEPVPFLAAPVPRRDRRRRSRRWWPFLALGACVLVTASLLVPSGRHQWAESLIRQPSSYSSLAFVDPTELPGTVVSGQALTFTFEVGNHESQDLVYRYLATSSPSKISAFGGSFGGGSVAIAAGQSRRVMVSADPHCAGSPCQISVVLAGQGEAIDFNVDVTGLGPTAGRT